MKAIINFLVSIALPILLTLLGAFIGFKIGESIEYPPEPPTVWKLLKGPVKFSEIIDVNWNGVLAKTSDRKLYYWDSPNWVEADNLPDDGLNDSPPMEKRRFCSTSDTQPPGKVVECVFKVLPSIPAMVLTQHALLKDGTIWEWFPHYSGSDNPILTLIIGPSVGLLLGALTAVFLKKVLFKLKIL